MLEKTIERIGIGRGRPLYNEFFRITTFENAVVGDRVWAIPYGWGEIQEINFEAERPIDVKFDHGRSCTFTLDGKLATWHVNRILFWDVVTLPEAPVKPKPKVMKILQVKIRRTLTGWQILFPDKDTERDCRSHGIVRFTSEPIEVAE